MRRRTRFLFATAAIIAVLAFGTVARAQNAPAANPDLEMTTTEMQSLSCLGTGGVSAATVAVLVLLSPLEALTLPVIAAAFAAGCGVGAVAAPGVHWIARSYAGWNGPRIVADATR